MQFIRSICADISKMVSIKYKNMVRDYNQKQRQERFQQQAQAVSYGQIYIQEALGRVLASTNILLNLTAITHPSDLIPCNYTIADVTIYDYRWLKKSPEKISSTMLETAREKINLAIEMETRKLSVTFQNLPEYEKLFFVQQYPAFYNGFRVVGLKDAGTDVIISVVMN